MSVLEREELVFTQTTDGKKLDFDDGFAVADHLPDKSDSLIFLYVYCDQIEPIHFRTEIRKLLLTVPVSWGYVP